MRDHEIYLFGEFVLEVAERRLSKSGRIVPLAPKAHDLFVALVRKSGTLVSKRDLLDTVWPDASVEEGILSVYVSALRKALGDNGGAAKWIETVSRAGYRFIGPVMRMAPDRDAISMRWPIGVLPATPAVSELIGRGRQHLLAASMKDVPKAVEAFRSAIALDDGYAAAHAGLALAHCAQAEFRLAAPGDAYAEARMAALRALAMDDSNADAQVALATVLFLSDWNWTGARRSLERALELDPDHTEALLLYGRLLEALGDLGGGLAAKQKALERHPLSAVVHMQIALSFWNQRQFDEVIVWANRALALDPSHLLAREFIASAYWQKGDPDRHIEEAIAHAKTYGTPAEELVEVKRVYAAGGCRAVIEYALTRSAHMTPVQLAIFHGELGNLDEAFRHLDHAIELHDPALVPLAVAPQWDRLRGDPRFDERVTAMRFR